MSDQSNRGPTARAFTLIEILVTITIIAVLAALLSPALKSAKDRAKLAQCIYNLHNIGLGNQLYVADNRGFAYFWEQNGGGAGAWWNELLLPYVRPGEYSRAAVTPWTTNWPLWRDKGGTLVDDSYITARYPIFQCPAAPKPTGTPYGKNYGGNMTIFMNHPSFAKPAPLDASIMDQRPSSIILACDSGGGSGWSVGINGPYITILNFEADPIGNAQQPVVTSPADDSETAALSWPIYSRHNGVCPAVMLDGHVRLFKNGEIQRRNFAGTWQTYYYNYAYP